MKTENTVIKSNNGQQEGIIEEAKDMKIDFDFLSSIEYLVLDQAEGFVF